MAGNYDNIPLFGRESPFRSKLDQVRGQRTTGLHSTVRIAPQQTTELSNPLQRLQAPGAAAGTSGSDEMERLALYDALTELNNHRTFMRELKYELKRGQRYKRPVAIAMICIDGFQELKSQWNQQAAENVLKAVAGLVRSVIREVDRPARYSADELAVIFPETNAAGVNVVAERIRQRIRSEAINQGWQQINLTASIGVASFPAHAREHDELIARAAQALEFATQRGGDRTCST